jgi:hypothetical protein
MYIVEILIKQKDFLQVLLFHQNPYRHLNSIVLFLSMDHKGSTSLSISSLGVSRLLHGNGSIYPIIETPQKLTQLHPMIPLKKWTKIQGRIGECNLFSNIPLFLESLELPQCNKYFLLKMKHIAHSSSQDPQSHQTSATTQPLQKSLTFIISLVLVLEEKHARPLDLFLTFLA